MMDQQAAQHVLRLVYRLFVETEESTEIKSVTMEILALVMDVVVIVQQWKMGLHALFQVNSVQHQLIAETAL